MTAIRLDYDTKLGPCQFIDRSERIAMVGEILNLQLDASNVRVEQTRKGFHVEVSSPVPISTSELISIQACMGSDPYREAINLARFRAHGWAVPEARDNADRAWNILFDEKITFRDGKEVTHSKTARDEYRERLLKDAILRVRRKFSIDYPETLEATILKQF